MVGVIDWCYYRIIIEVIYTAKFYYKNYYSDIHEELVIFFLCKRWKHDLLKWTTLHLISTNYLVFLLFIFSLDKKSETHNTSYKVIKFLIKINSHSLEHFCPHVPSEGNTFFWIFEFLEFEFEFEFEILISEKKVKKRKLKRNLKKGLSPMLNTTKWLCSV